MKRYINLNLMNIFLIFTIITIIVITAATIIVHASPLADNKKEPQKFTVKYTITYNSITLQQASDIEKRISIEHDSAYSINVYVENVINIDNNIYYYPNKLYFNDNNIKIKE